MALTASFIADFSSFLTATRDAVQAMQGFKNTAQELGPAADRSLADTQKVAEEVGRAVRRLGTDVAAASKTFIDAYAEEQDAVNRLNTALTATGQATPAVLDAYQALASQFQNTTKYADEAIINVEAVLTTIGHVGPENMQLALTAVTNLASAMKIDLTTAANLVAKSIQDGHEPVRKIRDLLGESYVKGMSAVDMFKALNEKVGPAAQNELNTYGGQVEYVKNQLSDFNEQIGKVLVDNLSGLLKAFQALPEPVQKFTIAVVAIGTAVAPVLVSLASLISILSTTGIGAAMMAALTAIVGVLTGPVGIAVAVVAVAAAIALNWNKITAWTAQLYTSIKEWLVDRFSALVGMIRGITDSIVATFRGMYQAIVGGSIVPDLITGIAAQFADLDAVMVQPARDATAAATAAFRSMAGPGAPGGLIAGGGGRFGALTGVAGATVVNISMTGMLGANDPQTRQAITQVVGDALAQSMRGQRLLSTA